jgi:beta-lactamase class A
MAELLVRTRRGEANGPEADSSAYRALCGSYWNEEALAALPVGVEAASKQGAVNRSRSEVVLVHAPAGEYVFCVITAEQSDTSWHADNAGFVLLREVSRSLWRAWGRAPSPPRASSR